MFLTPNICWNFKNFNLISHYKLISIFCTTSYPRRPVLSNWGWPYPYSDVRFETPCPLAPCRSPFSITIGGREIIYIEILPVLALKIISKGNAKVSAYGTNVILDRDCIWITAQRQHHHLSKSPFWSPCLKCKGIRESMWHHERTIAKQLALHCNKNWS